MLFVGEVEIWLGKFVFDVRLFNNGFFFVLEFEEWVDVDVDECVFEFDVFFFVEDVFIWLEIKVLFIDGCVRCLVMLYWRFIIYFSYC